MIPITQLLSVRLPRGSSAERFAERTAAPCDGALGDPHPAKRALQIDWAGCVLLKSHPDLFFPSSGPQSGNARTLKKLGSLHGPFVISYFQEWITKILNVLYAIISFETYIERTTEGQDQHKM